MSLYELPPEPLGPVWDKDGTEWWQNQSSLLWTSGSVSYVSWGDLLTEHGPLTDVPPAPAVGDTVTLAQFASLPHGSVAATGHTAFIVTSEGVLATGVTGVLDPAGTVTGVFSSLTLLRYGRGDDA